MYQNVSFLCQVKQICAQKSVQEQLIQEYNVIGDRQLQLKLENDEVSDSESDFCFLEYYN